VISVGGAKLTPEEVEVGLLKVPGVMEGRVFGVKNPIAGYLVGAEIVPEAGADVEQLREALPVAARAQLGPYKVPRVLRFVESIRVSEAGKKDRSA
jgi:acyl-coenzyme A synthetase/AMP-(fatty) acid ligase